jgi:glycosyltransferase involved in cell wall biosynthesis
MSILASRSSGNVCKSVMRPRLLTVIPNLGLAGAERVVANLLTAMQLELFDYHLVTLQWPAEFKQHRLPNHVQWSILGASRVEMSAPALSRYLRKLQPDLICSHIAAMNVVTSLAVALSGIRTKLILVDHHVASHKIVGSGPFHRLLLPAMRWAYPRSDRVIGVSSPVLETTYQIVRSPKCKGMVIPNPVVFPELEDCSLEPTGHPWLDNCGHEVILGVGRLLPSKNFKLLIDAFALVAKRRPRSRLIIIGSGPQRSALQDHISCLGLQSCAQLVGLKENPFSAMRRARLVAVTSASEGLSTVLIEAMACGTSVVTTDFASAKDALPSWGPQPVSHTPEAVADAIGEGLDHPVEPERLKAWASRFAAGPIARRYEGLFLDLLAERL